MTIYAIFFPSVTFLIPAPKTPTRLRKENPPRPHKKQRLHRFFQAFHYINLARLLLVQHPSTRHPRHHLPLIVDAIMNRPPYLLRVSPLAVGPSYPIDRAESGGKDVVPPQQPVLVPAYIFPYDLLFVVFFIIAEAELDVSRCGVHFDGRDDGGGFGAAVTEYELGFVCEEASPVGFAVVGCGFGGGGGREVEGYV